MKIELGRVPEDADRRLPESEPDASGIGVNYADAVLKVFKKTLDDGSKISCRRRGLEITLEIGGRTGKALMRRLEHGPDVRDILHHALTEAARQAGAVYSTAGGRITLEIDLEAGADSQGPSGSVPPTA